MQIRCDECRYFEPTFNHQGRLTDRGECRRRPPAMVGLSSEAFIADGHFPLVNDNDWCGEFASKGDAEANAAFDAAAHEDATDAAVCGHTGDA